MATFNGQVAHSDDDAWASTGTIGSLTNATSLYNDADQYSVVNMVVNVPQGATINSATLEYYVPNASYDDPEDISIYAVDADTHTIALAQDVSAYSATTATATWPGTGIGTGWASITVTSIVQEVVNRGGWSSGNRMTFVAKSTDAGCTMRYSMYDRNSSEGAKLTVDYTEVSGVPRHAMYYARLRAS